MARRALCVLLTLLAACTSGDGPRATGSGNGAPAPTSSPDPELRRVVQDYAECLRREGLDVTDPSFDDAGRVTAWPAYTLSDDARAAEQSCSSDVSELAFRPRGEAAIFLERGREFAECMADHGVPDVEVSLEHGVRIGPRSRNREIRSAERQCRSIMGGP